MMDEEIRQALCEVREMKKMCGNINMKLTNIVTQRGQDFKKKLEAEYQRGLEDGKAVNNKGCDGCLYNDGAKEHSPCDICRNAYLNRWTAKQTDDEIGVGDVVETKSGTIFAVTKITTDGFVVGFTGDGSTCCFNITKLTKTGEHYNINEILGGLSDDD